MSQATLLINALQYPILDTHVGIEGHNVYSDTDGPCMLQAITTKYIGPTNHRGPRVKATCEAGNLTMYWDDSMDIAENHRFVASMLHTKLGWYKTSTLVGGWDGDTGVFVQILHKA